ncbi:sigma 54-interacting transcriptional regulator (plasmid) [Paraclostridium bifermentans]|uniref:Sigma 54-interacting transcriptional regulator n=1 Tax=Paraclostridium bifermentans TaxID=1490 RepID=A0ABY8R8S3_PARBF|nr:sigma 54-interacting transcriptional regulator [Paraclostridium bifermentans]
MNKFLENTISEKVLNKKIPMSDMYSTYKNENIYSFVHANPIFSKNEFLGVVCTEVDIADAKKLYLELQQANDRIKYLQNEVKNLSNGSFDKILGKSYKLEKAKQIAKQVSKTQSSVFIRGESGTGKEIFARAIHEYSEKSGQFVPINCSAIPSELFESEFFGYESGSFTGANKKGKMGIFELAKDGTLFLDEIADMPLNMQAKLLRVLQEREIRRIGGEDTVKVNARIISATNKNLKELVLKEKFREDLYYRLNVVEINVPPLRERKDDIPLLIHNFIEILCKENKKSILNISKDAINLLQNYTWKGNIRELRNTIENLVVLTNDSNITPKDLPDYIIKSVENNVDEEIYPLDLAKATQRIETLNILKALKISNGNKAQAAKILNIPRTTLYYKIDRYKININS